MFRLSLLSFTLLFSFALRAEVCEGLNACSELYTQMTGQKLTMDKSISDDMSIAVPSTTMESKNATGEFTNFLNKNVINLLPGGKLQAMRHGEFLTVPIYVVSTGNMPMMINKDGLVTMVYQTQKVPTKLVSSKIRKMLSKKKAKSTNNIVEFNKNQIIAVSDTFEHATKIMTEIMKTDKL